MTTSSRTPSAASTASPAEITAAQQLGYAIGILPTLQGWLVNWGTETQRATCRDELRSKRQAHRALGRNPYLRAVCDAATRTIRERVGELTPGTFFALTVEFPEYTEWFEVASAHLNLRPSHAAPIRR
jgi:hypothetical protein